MPRSKARKGISVRVRFEVFQRDDFTCRYCGQRPPNVKLVLDHLLPVAAGGDDAPENLVTSCEACNSGKSAALLQEGSIPPVTETRLGEMRRSIEVQRQYVALRREREEMFAEDAREFFSRWNVNSESPAMEAILGLLREGVPLDVLLNAANATDRARRGGIDRWRCVPYFFGCVRNHRPESS